MPTQTSYDVRSLARMVVGPILGPVPGVINKFFTPVMPVAWAFEQSQRNFSVLLSIVGVIVSVVYFRGGPRRRKARAVGVWSIMACIVLALLYVGFLEQISPNPSQLPLTHSTLGPVLILLYAIPFFCLSLGISTLGLSGMLAFENR